MRKVVMIGLDGMSWEVFESLRERGVMPNLSKILRKAVRMKLISTIPPTTASAWSSILTGVNPGKHGLFYFRQNKAKKGVKLGFVTTFDVMVPRIHEMLALNGKLSIIVNMPYSIPCLVRNKCIAVKDWLSLGRRIVECPLRFKSPISELFKDYVIPGVGPYMNKFKDKSLYLNLLYVETSKRIRILCDLLETLEDKYPWSYLFILFSETDWLFHGFLDKILSGRGKYVHRLFKIFTLIDNFMGYIKDNFIDENTLLCILSDHGFTQYNHEFRLLQYLFGKGLLRSESLTRIFLRKLSQNILWEGVLQPIRALKALFKRDKPRNVHKTSVVKRLARNAHTLHVSYGIYLNEHFIGDHVGRLAYLLKKSMNAYKIRNVKPFLGVWLREEIYKGPYINRMPHVVFLPNEVAGIWPTYRLGPLLWKSKFFNHSMYGIASFYSESSELTQNVKTCTTYDILPTVLSYMKLFIPHNVDGNVLSIMNVDRIDVKRKNYLTRWNILRKLRFKGSYESRMV